MGTKTEVRAEPEARTANGTPGGAGRARLVVINDDTPFLELMEALLEGEEGYDVRVRKEWNKAYEYVKEVQPDLVILDIVMGSEERGWNILNLLTLDPETRDIPVLVCSAAVQSLRQHAPMLERHGITSLAKPFDLEQLLAAVQQMLEAAETAEAAEARKPERAGGAAKVKKA
jgi:CheY-like chemotaxis protein